MAVGGNDLGKSFISQMTKMLRESYNAYFKVKGFISECQNPHNALQYKPYSLSQQAREAGQYQDTLKVMAGTCVLCHKN